MVYHADMGSLRLEDMAEEIVLVREATAVMNRLQPESMQRHFATIFSQAGWNVHRMRFVVEGWRAVLPDPKRTKEEGLAAMERASYEFQKAQKQGLV